MPKINWLMKNCQNCLLFPGLIEHSYRARTLQGEAGGSRVLCLAGLPNNTLSQKAKLGAVEIVQSVMTSAQMKTCV